MSWAAFDLGNAGEVLTIEKPNPVPLLPDIPLDRVRYNDKPPWPTEADGAGPSLERVPVTGSGNDSLHWRANAMQGTPGRAASGSGGIAVARGSFWEYKVTSASLGTSRFWARSRICPKCVRTPDALRLG